VGGTRYRNLTIPAAAAAAAAVQRGQRDTFCVAAPDLGALSHVVVVKQGGGLSGDWHLQMVEVMHPGNSSWQAMIYTDIHGLCLIDRHACCQETSLIRVLLLLLVFPQVCSSASSSPSMTG
jgi:hypothetical protein